MPKMYDNTDLLWTSRGDIHIGPTGDIMDTENDPLRSLFQEIQTRVKADIGDWEVFPDIGSSIGDFIGEPNNAITAESIKVRVLSCLTRDGFISNKDLKVIYTPIGTSRLMIRINVKVMPTVRNGYSETLTMNMVYDYSNNSAFFM